jgi:hypothetical protein
MVKMQNRIFHSIDGDSHALIYALKINTIKENTQPELKQTQNMITARYKAFRKKYSNDENE